jgi:predicted secreted protein
MPWFSILAIFFVVWFLALFITLPFGVKRVENPEPGQDHGAPEQPYMWHKLGASFILAALLTAGLVYAFGSGLIDFRT